MKTAVLVLLTFIALMAIAGALTPSFREKIQSYMQSQSREVLATAEGDLLNDGSIVKAVKYKSAEGIFVEILRSNSGSAFSLVDRIQLPDKHDGLFNFHGHITRLAITDIDGNGGAELLAPTFDAQLVPHLNIFRYNSGLQKFESVQPPQKP